MISYNKKKQHKWERIDIQLANGFQFYTDSLCQGCGTPYWYGHSEDNMVDFDNKKSVCYACKARKDVDAKPGEYVVTNVVSSLPDDTPLPAPWEAGKKTQ